MKPEPWTQGDDGRWRRVFHGVGLEVAHLRGEGWAFRLTGDPPMLWSRMYTSEVKAKRAAEGAVRRAERKVAA